MRIGPHHTPLIRHGSTCAVGVVGVLHEVPAARRAGVFVEDVDHVLRGERAVGIDDGPEQVVRRHGRALAGGSL